MAKASHSGNLTDANIEKVIGLLAAEKPITKKAACEILGITYNVTRLQSLIDAYVEKRKLFEQQYKKKMGTPATEHELSGIIESVLEGEPITAIAKRYFRSDAFVRGIVKKCGVPIRDVSATYEKPSMIPDVAVTDTFSIKEKVFSAKYQSMAEIRSVHKSREGENVYGIWVFNESQSFHAYQPWWELGSIQHLKQYGVKT